MSFLHAFRHRLRSALRPDTARRERDDEFAFHVSLAERDAEPGADTARRAFGNRTYLSEEVRWMGATRWIDSIRQDIRYGLRALRRSPAFTLVAVLSVGLGVGANTAVFGIIHSMLLAELPVPRPRELVMLRRASVEYGAYFNWEEQQAVARAPGAAVTGFTTWYSDSTMIDGSLVPVDNVDLVAGNFHQVLGLAPAAGRLLTPADERAALTVAVVTYDLAVRYFASPAAALGHVIRFHSVPFTIVGVAPRGYNAVMLSHPAPVAVPRTTGALIHPRRDPPAVLIIARVPGPASAQAAAILGTYRSCCADAQLTGRGSFGPRAKASDPIELTDISRGITVGKFDVRVEFSRTLYALMGGVALLLLIACTNVGNLLLARALVRSRELAVRLSLGASRARIVRQLLVESSLLAALGAVLGVFVAVIGTALIARSLPANLRMLQEFVVVRPNAMILAFTVVVAIVCVLLFGALPAFRATRFDLLAQLRDARTASRFSRLDRGLVAVQVGLALVLASVSGLFVATLHNLVAGTDTVDPEHLLIAEFEVGEGPYAGMPMRSLYGQIEAQLRRIPGVQRVALTDLAPMLFMGGNARVLDAPGFESVPNEEMWSGVATVAPGYFATMSIDFRGRDFTAQDLSGSEPVAVIGQRLATEFFAGRDPIGQRLRFRGDRGPGPSFRIIGVAEDVKYFDLRARPPRQLYFPWTQSEDSAFGGRPIFAIRTEPRAATLVRAATNAIATTFPGLQFRRLRSMAENASLILGREQALVALSITFGTLALSLAAIGLYGVLAFHVSSRRREIGVRIALGAEAHRVVAMVLRQSFAVIVVGTLLGVPLSLAASRSLAALLYGIPPWHPAPVLVAVLVLVAVGVLASFLPSRSAARVDPLVAMRAE